jgi:hypothetical protein
MAAGRIIFTREQRMNCSMIFGPPSKAVPGISFTALAGSIEATGNNLRKKMLGIGK